MLQAKEAESGASGGADLFDVDTDEFAELDGDPHLGAAVDEKIPAPLPFHGVVILLMTPWPPRDWKQYAST